MPEAIVSSFLGFMVFFWVIGLAVAVLVIIATWKIYEKAGEPGWASLVPFYRDYVFFKISWGNGWYFLLNTVPAVIMQIAYLSFYMKLIMEGIESYGSGYFNEYGLIADTMGMGALMSLLGIFTLVISIITYVKLAKAFGQSGGFACGLIFLAPVFLCIMAFSKDIYYVGIPGKTPPYGAPYDRQGYGGPNRQDAAWQDPYYRPTGTQPPLQYGPGWGWQSPEPQQNMNRQQGASPQEAAKYCPDCGMALKKEDAFCPRCGKPQQH